jgi:hypothetical protein
LVGVTLNSTGNEAAHFVTDIRGKVLLGEQGLEYSELLRQEVFDYASQNTHWRETLYVHGTQEVHSALEFKGSSQNTQRKTTFLVSCITDLG